MKHKPFNALLIVICLLSISAGGTHVLLAAHLTVCHDTHETGRHSHNSNIPGHDHSKCPVCQLFSGVSGKYISPTTNIYLPGDIFICDCIFFLPSIHAQHASFWGIPRAPPLA